MTAVAGQQVGRHPYADSALVEGAREATDTPAPEYDIVVPTIGRESLGRLMAALSPQLPPGSKGVFVVDDRPGGGPPLGLEAPVRVLRSNGGGPAAARNTGWRAGTAPWVVFLDDDVLTPMGWGRQLLHDLTDADAATAAVQGRIVVPMPVERRPTDWERNVSGLEGASWVTADIAYRRHVLEETGGFDERFHHAFREDSDLALRAQRLGYDLSVGTRVTFHPVRPAGRWVSVRLQRGNADDAMMRALHGKHWRQAAAAPDGGRMMAHGVTVAAALTAVALALRRDWKRSGCACLLWVALFSEFALRRILPGPRDRREVATMLFTSALIPPAAALYRVSGMVRAFALARGPRHTTAREQWS